MIFDSPLINVLRAVRDWCDAREVFWMHRTEQTNSLRELRRKLKEIVIWLELHDGEVAAAHLDAAMGELSDRWWEFERVCDAAAPVSEGEPRCCAAAHEVLVAANKLSGALEDLAGQLPDSIWQGFDDV